MTGTTYQWMSVLAMTVVAGYLMIQAGTGKRMLSWKQHQSRVVPWRRRRRHTTTWRH